MSLLLARVAQTPPSTGTASGAITISGTATAVVLTLPAANLHGRPILRLPRRRGRVLSDELPEEAALAPEATTPVIAPAPSGAAAPPPAGPSPLAAAVVAQGAAEAALAVSALQAEAREIAALMQAQAVIAAEMRQREDDDDETLLLAIALAA